MKTITKERKMAFGTLAVLAATTFGTTLAGATFTPAEAQRSKRSRNVALGAAAVTAYGLVKKKKTVAVVGGLGTLYAYSRYRKNKKRENAAAENRRARWYKQRYGRNWRTYYKPGA